MTRLDAETRAYVKREIDRLRRIEIEGLRPNAPRWTPTSVLEAIRAFEAMTGRTPSRADFDSPESTLPSARTVGRIFGSTNRAIDLAFPATARVEIEQTTLFEAA